MPSIIQFWKHDLLKKFCFQLNLSVTITLQVNISLDTSHFVLTIDHWLLHFHTFNERYLCRTKIINRCTVAFGILFCSLISEQREKKYHQTFVTCWNSYLLQMKLCGKPTCKINFWRAINQKRSFNKTNDIAAFWYSDSWQFFNAMHFLSFDFNFSTSWKTEHIIYFQWTLIFFQKQKNIVNGNPITLF